MSGHHPDPTDTILRLRAEKVALATEYVNRLADAEAERDRFAAALKRNEHMLENIADPYNERLHVVKKWAEEALVVTREALAEVVSPPSGLTDSNWCKRP